MVEPVKCRGKKCGAAIFFAELESGTRIPLDVRPVLVYRLPPDDGAELKLGGTPRAEVIELADKAYISHYLTCKDPEQFKQGAQR